MHMIYMNKNNYFIHNQKKGVFFNKKAGINVCRFIKKELSLNLIFVTK